MSKSLNSVQLIGNLGKDPELKYTASGVAVANFTMATSDSWKDQEGNLQERTEWHNITAWRKLAEICGEYLKKGSKVFVQGKLQTQSWEQDGVKKYKTLVVIDQLIMLDSRPQSSERSSVDDMPEDVFATPPGRPQDNKEDDLPF